MAVRTRPALAVVCLALTSGCAALVPVGNDPSTGSAARPTIASTTQLDPSRPRIVLRAADVAVVQARVTRSPYSLLMSRLDAQIGSAAPPSVADQADCGATPNIGREEAKARAAKDLSFLYAINRVWDATTQSVVVPSAAQRQTLGDRARDYLVASCITSRIHIQPDRDINTSNEMIQMAAAYDTLAGSGYDLGASEAVIVQNLVHWANEFYDDYQPFLKFLTNNHLAKGAASLGTVAIALAGAPGTDTAQLDRWLDFGMTQVENVVRYSLGAGDGTYGEGPFYWRYASQNVVPFTRAYDSASGGASWLATSGTVVSSPWRSQWFTDIGRWELDMTRPDGTLVPIDDGNPDDAYYFGALPSTAKDASAYAWRWANAATTSGSVPYESNGNVDMAADEIVTFDDSVVPAPPTGSPNRLHGEGGDLVFRGNWTSDAVAAFVQAEHGGSRGFGTPPGQPGIPFAAVHDHADPGSFQLDAYGERLLLDPGYVNYTWTLHGTFSDPSAHNMVLVGPATDPQSPGNPNTASTVPTPALDAFTTQPGQPVPVDGEAFVSDVVDVKGLAAATVTTRYGRDPAYVAPSPLSALDFEELDNPDAATVQRRFVFVDKRFLVIADSLQSPKPRTYSWPLHGNGGGTDGMTAPIAKLNSFDKMFEPAAAIPATPYSASGGAFVGGPDGGLWERARARVQSAMAFDRPVSPVQTTSLGLYEQVHGRLGSNTVLTTQVQASDVRAASVIYPSRTSGAAPVVRRLAVQGAAVLRVSDSATDHEILVVVRAPGLGDLSLPATLTGMPVDVRTDAAIAIVDVHHDGSVSKQWSEGGSYLVLG